MATLTICKRRYVRCLAALQDEWEKKRKWRHSQTSGFVLAALACDPWLAAGQRLQQTLDFIKQNGPHGVDGILLSAMSAANVINHDMFARAEDVLGNLGKIDAAHKEGMGIYFLDLGAALEKGLRGCRVPSGWWNPDFLDSLGIDGLEMGFLGKLSGGLLSCAPDEFRAAMFGDPPISGLGGAGFGPDHSAIMERLLGEMDPSGRNGLCGMTEAGCLVACPAIFSLAGAKYGARAGLGGAALGLGVGLALGGVICGMYLCDYSDKKSNGSGGGDKKDEDPDEAGVCEEPDETETIEDQEKTDEEKKKEKKIYDPDNPTGTHAGERAVKAWTQSMGAMMKGGNPPWYGKGQPLPVGDTEGAASGKWILPDFPVIMEGRALADKNLNRYINYGPDFPATGHGKISDEAMAYLQKKGPGPGGSGDPTPP